MWLFFAIDSNHSEHTRHISFGLDLPSKLITRGSTFSFAATVPKDIFKKQLTKEAVDYVKVVIASGPEVQYEWKDKLRKHDYLATYCKMAIVVEGDLKAPFSIATAQRCRRGCNSLLNFTLDSYLIMLSVKQGCIKYNFWVFGITRPEIEL